MPQSLRRCKPSLDRVSDCHVQLLLRYVSGREDRPVDDDGGVLGPEARRHGQMEPRRVDVAQVVDGERRLV